MLQDDYFKAGYKIFGLHGTSRGMCECGNESCEAFFKHPRVSNWQYTPNWSQDQFDVMEMTGQFATGFGVLCDGYLIIDIDPRNGGNDGYAKLEKDTGISFKDDAGFVVATGGGGWHIYYKYEEAARLNAHLKEYKGIDFKSSGFVVGAGSMHKSGSPYEVEEGFPDELTAIPDVLLQLLIKKVPTKSEFNPIGDIVTAEEVKTYLSYVPNIDVEYDDWIEIGMIIHDALSGDGYEMWEEWSRSSEKFDPASMEYKWHSFGKSSAKVTIGTLIAKANENGYSAPVTFQTTLTHDVNLLKVKDIDLDSAPGLVGECIDYINGCSRFPRKALAVSAGLMAISNIGGMRFEDEAYGVTPNLFTFNVAGSATGKEAIQQAHSDLVISAGLGGAVYGTIKSEQEIYRNVYRNQLTAYVIDEFGILLNKIEQGSKGASASYLGGVIGALMSIYSKANGVLPLGADFGETIIAEVRKEIAAICKLVDNNEARDFHHKRLESLQALEIQMMNGYLNNPYLTLSGYTTPATFNGLVSYAQATNGFIGRSILFEEKDNNPRAKRGFKKNKLPPNLEHELKKLNNGGDSSMNTAGRVEFNGQKEIITTSDDAMDLLDEIDAELYGCAALAMETNGLEAIVRRSFELVLKVSMVLAMGDKKVRTVDHVRWSYALIKKDIDNKINLTGGNMAAEEKNLANELLSKVTHKLDTVVGLSIGTISNKIRSMKREDIQKALDHLVLTGVACEKTITPAKGAIAVKYYLN